MFNSPMRHGFSIAPKPMFNKYKDKMAAPNNAYYVLTESHPALPNASLFDDLFDAKDTDNLSEGTSNLYYTDARVLATALALDGSNADGDVDIGDNDFRISGYLRTNYITSIATSMTIATPDLEVTGNMTANNLLLTDWNTAYAHSQDNSQAHSDYLINNGDDTTSGKLTASSYDLTDDTTGYQIDGVTIVNYVNSQSVLIGDAGNTSMSTGGNGNVYIGEGSGFQTTSGFGNLAMGPYSLAGLTEGGTNLAFGEVALSGVSSGDRNIGMGYLAGSNIDTGSGNIMIGDHTSASTPEADDNLNIGGVLKGLMISNEEYLHLPIDNEKLYFGEGRNAGLWYDGSHLHIDAQQVGSGNILLDNLPASDPAVANAIWNDSGTLKISSG